MSKSKTAILDEMQDFMRRHGPNYNEWYVGTSGDPQTQMFNVHKFKNGDKGLFRQAKSGAEAAEIVRFFTNLGDKGVDGGARASEFVYPYERAAHTLLP